MALSSVKGDLYLWLAKRARAMALLAFILLILFALAVRPPTFSGSMVDEIGEGNPQLKTAEEISAARGYRETVLILLESADLTIALADDAIRSLEKKLSDAGLDADVRSVRTLTDRLFLFGLTREDTLRSLHSALAQDNDVSGIFSRDGALFVVGVTVPGADEARTLELIRAHAFGDGAGDETNNETDNKISYEIKQVAVLAAVALEQDVASGLRQDLRLLIPAIVFVMLAVLLIAFGHWRALVLPAFGSIASSVVVFGVFSLADVSINLVTLLALPIVLIVALANSCHFLAKSRTVLAAAPDRTEAIAMTLRRVATPYLISCLTTAVALGSLAFNDIGPIRDLGLLSSLSLLVSFFLILLFAPWSLRWHLGARGPSSNQSLHQSRLYRVFSNGLHDRRRMIAAILMAAAVLSLFSLPSIEVRSDSRIFFPDNAEFTRAFLLFEEQFFVFAPLRILLLEEQAAEPSIDALRSAGELREQVVALDGVLAAELAPAANGAGLLITATLARESAATAVVEKINELKGTRFDQYEIAVSSAELVYESIDRQAMSSLMTSLSVSLMIIFGVIALLFRSWRLLLASLLANAIPLLIVFGFVWFVGDPLNLVTAFVFLVALGVIVDDTIHILYRYQHGETIAGSSIEFSVVLTTVMLCAGLLLCQLSDFPTTRQFALYCALALTVAMSSDLTLLPALLRYRDSPLSVHSSR